MKARTRKSVIIRAFLLAACLITLVISLWIWASSGSFSELYGGYPRGTTFKAADGIDVNYPQAPSPSMYEEISESGPIEPTTTPGEKLLYGHQYRRRLLLGSPPDGGTYFWEYNGCVGTPIAYWAEGTLWIPDSKGKWQPYRPLDYAAFVEELEQIPRH